MNRKRGPCNSDTKMGVVPEGPWQGPHLLACPQRGSRGWGEANSGGVQSVHLCLPAGWGRGMTVSGTAQQPSTHTLAGLGRQRLETGGAALLIPSLPALWWMYLRPQLISALPGCCGPWDPNSSPRAQIWEAEVPLKRVRAWRQQPSRPPRNLFCETWHLPIIYAQLKV